MDWGSASEFPPLIALSNIRGEAIEIRKALDGGRHQNTDFTIADTPAINSSTWASVGSVFL